jgi:hypothetical protein
MDGDRPISHSEDDRLGFSSVAEHLARVIVDQSARDGLVFGIEGEWGSGKSSLINLTKEALRRCGGDAPEIIEFSPWLVGSRDELLRTLFDELTAAAVNIDPTDQRVAEAEANASSWQRLRRFLTRDEHWRLRQKALLRRHVAGKLQAFGKLAGAAGKVVKIAAALGLPGADLSGVAIEGSGGVAGSLLESTSLSKRKAELVGVLKHLSRRIVVFVDDLDRLEPREASEVLRLIRAVADFPNVIYALSYDPRVIAKCLREAVHVDDGAAFLEKIVQVSFRVPRPEAFDLRRWFQAEVVALFSSELTMEEDPQGVRFNQRLAEAIDFQGGRYLNTPRDVVRALNGLRLHAIPVRHLIDIPDMVWLQLVRVGNPALYAWVEEYLTEVAALANGAILQPDAARRTWNRLQEILAEEQVDVERTTIELSRILPGLDRGLGFGGGDERQRAFNLAEHALNTLIASRRLGSPQHYRYYFAFSEPAGALRDDEVRAFLSVAENSPDDAIAMFSRLARQMRPQGGSMAGVLIDRLVALSDRIPAAAIVGILRSLAEAMDEVALSSRDGDFGQERAWLRANQALARLLKRVGRDTRAVCLEVLFQQGRALGWLTDVLRDEIFAHGHFGDRRKPEDEWLLSTAEFVHALEVMLRRYREMPPADLMGVPNLMRLLYAWQQGSGTDEARRWVEAQTATDAGLLRFLSRVRGWAVRDVVCYPLKRRDLERFLDYESAVRRVQEVQASPDTTEADRRLAAELLVAIRQGADLEL